MACKALTEMRIRTPWVEALKKQREEGSNPTKTPKSPATPQDRDLMPKKMSESFTRVVSGNPLCDPLSDAVLRGSDLFERFAGHSHGYSGHPTDSS
jgi:hypothetical protein